jgi:predicted O-methyltransferase YrrM
MADGRSTGIDPELATTLEEVSEIDGWLREEQAQRLWAAARRLSPPARIVEIGSFHGRSTIVLARGAALGVEVVAIDPHDGNDRAPLRWQGTPEEGSSDYLRFQENLRRTQVADRVTHVRFRSQDALSRVPGPIDVLYIDGAHGYRPAVADVHQWGDRVAAGGTMLIHDAYLSIGVTGALVRRLFFGHSFRYVGRSRSMA